jgi:hypothetical protein
MRRIQAVVISKSGSRPLVGLLLWVAIMVCMRLTFHHTTPMKVIPAPRIPGLRRMVFVQTEFRGRWPVTDHIDVSAPCATSSCIFSDFSVINTMLPIIVPEDYPSRFGCPNRVRQPAHDPYPRRWPSVAGSHASPQLMVVETAQISYPVATAKARTKTIDDRGTNDALWNRVVHARPGPTRIAP